MHITLTEEQQAIAKSSGNVSHPYKLALSIISIVLLYR